MSKPRCSGLDLNQTLKDLSAGRNGAITVCASAKINGPVYDSAGVVIEAIDDLVEHLTGGRKHFGAKPHTTPSGPHDGK